MILTIIEVIQKGNKISFVPKEGKKKLFATQVELEGGKWSDRKQMGKNKNGGILSEHRSF